MCSDEKLFQDIDDCKRCKACGEGGLYYATYIGPLYCAAKYRVLFIGLDHGKEKTNVNLRQRQKDMIDWAYSHGKEWARSHGKKRGRWNQHYEGCIKTAGYLLDSACGKDCASRCALRAEPSQTRTEGDCVFLQLAQGNAVKCVHSTSTTMRFRGSTRIPDCLPLMFEELPILRPDLIFVQGRTSLYWPLCEVARMRGVQIKATTSCYVDLMVWPTWQSVIVFLNHPGMGHLRKDWDGEIVPALDEARKHLPPLPRSDSLA